MKEKHFDQFRHNMKNSIIELQFIMEDHRNGDKSDSEYLANLKEAIHGLSLQTIDLEQNISDSNDLC